MSDAPTSPLQDLSDNECLDLLARHSLGRLALVIDGKPMIYPVNYVLEGESVVIRTAPGAKLDHAPLSAVAFEVDDADPAGAWGWSVVVQGPCFDVSSSVDELSQRVRSLPLHPWVSGAHEHWLRIAIRHLSGRSFGGHPGR